MDLTIPGLMLTISFISSPSFDYKYERRQLDAARLRTRFTFPAYFVYFPFFNISSCMLAYMYGLSTVGIVAY